MGAGAGLASGSGGGLDTGRGLEGISHLAIVVAAPVLNATLWERHHPNT